MLLILEKYQAKNFATAQPDFTDISGDSTRIDPILLIFVVTVIWIAVSFTQVKY
jgi:hypothetical protein